MKESNIKRADLDKVEKFADKKLNPLDIDFTKHFFDRAIDPRNVKPISKAELISFFKRLAKYKDKFVDFLRKYTQFVVKDRRYQLNIPFVRKTNRLVAKTIMRKPDFLTSNPQFFFEGKEYNRFFEDLAKGKWQDLDKPEKYADNLIQIVQMAYQKAPDGSFIRSKRDVKQSEWQALNYSKNPTINATIFYRRSRSDEPWKGIKIQGIGHDGDRAAIDVLLKRLKTLLNKKGIWVEASDAMEHVLYKLGAPYVDDEEFARKVFPDTNLKMTGKRGQYTRRLKDSPKRVTETIFGQPALK